MTFSNFLLIVSTGNKVNRNLLGNIQQFLLFAKLIKLALSVPFGGKEM
ncbi:unnamed protein product [Staurois parvus]|uniref:Uncharacterized protein n=1 Tax=Staurois parvus TaxID=386267 RepID=A0ABN9CRK3_9NEOB|nr:unnamed protein product [Staurois parvus]